jgi:hypothetical protein
MNKFNAIKNLINKKITEEEARKLVGLKSVRQIRRIKKRVIKEGASGVVHRSRGKPGNRRFNKEFSDKAVALLKEKYSDYKPTFASEKLRENHNIIINKESLRQIMIKEALWRPNMKKQAKNRHVWRARKDNYGEMQQFDGSYHKWLEKRLEEELCLLLSIDDATGKITHAKFDKNEGVIAVFNFWMEYFERNGFPISIYLDKFSTYKINHPSAVDNKDLITQFQRAMQQVGVNPITAHSPEAKGRVERVFQTLQDRLVKEMRLVNISTTEEANNFLETYIPKFNQQFAVLPKSRADLHKPVDKKMKQNFHQIFSIQSKRNVNNDYTVLFKNKFFQLEEKQSTTVFKKDSVTIEEHLTGEIKIRLNAHYLDYVVLPERPKKIKDMPLIALTNRKAPHTPSANHPWRNLGVIPRKQAMNRSLINNLN